MPHEFTQKIGEFLGIDIDKMFGTSVAARQTLEVMKALCVQDDCCQYHQYKYRGMLHQTARRLTAAGSNDTQKIGAIFSWVLTHTRFQPDPKVQYQGKMVESDYLKKPCVIFDEIESTGKAACDCDDHSIILAGLFKHAGLHPGFLAISGNGKYLDHVTAFCFNSEKGINQVCDPQNFDPRTYGGKTLEMWV